MSSIGSASTLLSMEPIAKRRPRRCSPAIIIPPELPLSPSSLSVDATFEPTIDDMVNDFDDEQTLNDEEILANIEAQNPEEEIATLKEESEMPLEELLAKYGAMPPIESKVHKKSKKHNGKRKRKTSKSFGIEIEEHAVQSDAVSENHITDCDAVPSGDVEKQQKEPEESFDFDETFSDGLTHTSLDTVASSNPSVCKKQKRSRLMELYPEECFGENKAEPEDERQYVPLEMLYDDGDDEYEGEEDAETELDYFKKTIMVGSAYQADIPAGLSLYDDILPYENEDKLVWEPSQVCETEVEEYLMRAHEIMKTSVSDDESRNISDDKAEEVVSSCLENCKAVTEEKNNVEVKIPATNKGTETIAVVKDNEQALQLLVQCGYDFKEALRRNRVNGLPVSGSMSSWSEEERLKFEEGIQKYGKDFPKIRQILVRTRTMREMIHFYYLWKKSESREQSFGNTDAIDQVDVYLNELGADYASNLAQIGTTDASTVTDAKKSTRNYSIMIGSGQNNTDVVGAISGNRKRSLSGSEMNIAKNVMSN